MLYAHHHLPQIPANLTHSAQYQPDQSAPRQLKWLASMRQMALSQQVTRHIAPIDADFYDRRVNSQIMAPTAKH
jgi:hypothetical protein